MSKLLSGARAILLSGLVAILLTVAVSGVWAGLLSANLHRRPDLPWSALGIVILLAGLWWWLRGGLGRSPAAKARRAGLRDAAIPASIGAWAVITGLVWLVSLGGLWIVLHQLVPGAARPQPDYSKLGAVMTFASFAAAAIAGAVSEEAGFRGYFQGALERHGFGPAAILIAALLIAPLHAITQGFVWPTMVFYLCVDLMLGALAYITKSIRPGIAVHAVGLFVFFAFIWPQDAHRRLVWRDGADGDFWVSVGVAAVFSVIGVLALVRLAALVRRRGDRG
jgi:membrane protease YdiL (CAAX protease family)